MVPRTVQAKKQISSLIGPEFESKLGNVLGPQGFGWSNVEYRWFLNGPETLGSPVFGTYVINHYDEDGTPYYSQPPVRGRGTLGSFIYPVADSPVDPPLSVVSSFYP